MAKKILRLCEFTDGTFGVEIAIKGFFGTSIEGYKDLKDNTYVWPSTSKHIIGCKGTLDQAKAVLDKHRAIVKRYVDEVEE